MSRGVSGFLDVSTALQTPRCSSREDHYFCHPQEGLDGWPAHIDSSARFLYPSIAPKHGRLSPLVIACLLVRGSPSPLTICEPDSSAPELQCPL